MHIAWTVATIAEALATDDVLYLADDDQGAQALAAALRAALPDQPVFFVPSSDALPGDAAPASPANVGARVAALHGLRLAKQAGEAKIVCVASGEAAARRYPAPEAFDTALPRLSPGDALEAESFAALITEIGYYPDDRVDEPGEMAVRGEVIDIFPADAGLPARIEIAEGRIAALRAYDPVTQLSVADLDCLEIGRVAEPPVESATALLDHIGGGVLMLADKADKRRRRFIQLAKDAARARPSTLDAIDDDGWQAALDGWRSVEADEEFETVPRFAEARSPLAVFARFAKPLLESRSLVLAGSERDIRFLRSRVAKRLGVEIADLAGWAAACALEPGHAGALLMPVDQGFVSDSLVLVAAADLLGSRALTGDAPSLAAATPYAAAEIRIGDIVVHEDHGVGSVAGLEPAPDADGGGGEMIVLDYAGGARRLVGVEEADRIWRYGGDADAVTLDKLDGSSWQKRRGDIAAAVAESARVLAELAAARDALEAPVMEPDAAAYERFAAGFPFNETADQARAIQAVRDDLARGKPMDRLVIGDVGYGKTEVALRAAAIAALSGYQVNVAAPTTVLVRQHLAGFQRRFEGTGLTVAGLSRLSSAAEKKAAKAGLADGSIDIVVGTAAVMGKGVTYKRLGLVVIDEEQRFGAADKARLRGSGEVHLLSLSATPIPRTLQSALVGLQQMSVIATPPARRQPIRTSLSQGEDATIRTALLREKSRGGQSFVVVPRIEDMAKVAARLAKVVPDLKVVEAHGKMPAAEIDAAMVGFADGEGDILLATNIIEAGLDVPRANTMIVWRADRFGLAQLHQLRGRVGRGNRRGQVMLLTAEEDAIGERTLKRLRTLAAFDRLGAGFDISAQDLDMRGAGDLLGETQAGHMKLIGVDLYQHLLGAALREARGERVEVWTPELKVGTRGRLPEDWIPEADVRLTLYIRLGRIEDDAGLDAFEDELADRFGPLPDEAARLMAQARLRLAARAAGIAKVDAGPAAIALTPRPGFAGDAAAHGLVVKGDRLLLTEALDEDARAERVQALLEALAG